MKRSTSAVGLLALVAFALPLCGCEQKAAPAPAVKDAGKKMEEGAKKMEEGAKQAEDAAKKATENMPK